MALTEIVILRRPQSGRLEGRKVLIQLEFRDARLGAVFVLLRGAAADAAGALDDAVADDRHRALAHDHLSAPSGGNAARPRLLSARRHRDAVPPRGVCGLRRRRERAEKDGVATR